MTWKGGSNDQFKYRKLSANNISIFNADISRIIKEVGVLMGNLFYEQLEKECEDDKERMTKEELDNITHWIKNNIMRDSNIMFDDNIRGDCYEFQDIDMIEVIASLHNMLYKEVTGEYYDYMFHWANKIGSWVYDDLFKKEGEKRERN